MKGGYQILDLTGATAGSPVEVKGIYKAAAGNNGKPVMILTNDGQRVYAEIAEDGGDFITCYISAEGKTVNITIKSDDSVTTVISDPGASITGLEQAVNELNDNKAAKSDITDLECTGTKNTTGNTIAAGRYFYLNGALCKATADIANGATFTLNTNFTVVTIDEELRALNSKITTISNVEFSLDSKGYGASIKRCGKIVYFSCETTALVAGENELFTITNSADHPIYTYITSGYICVTNSDRNKENHININSSNGKCIIDIESGTTYGITISGMFMTS